MKKSLLSFITLLIFSVALTACSGGGGGGGGTESTDTKDNGDNTGGDPFAPSNNIALNALDALPSKNSQTVDTKGYATFDAVTDATITLGGLAVTLNDITQYTRETTDTAWTDSDNLQIDRQITPTRIASPVVAFTFDKDGNISGVASEYIKAYTATGNAPLSSTRFTGTYKDDELSINVEIDRSEDFFGFDSAHMAYIGWNVDGTLSDDDVATTQTIYDIDGMVIAGFETQSLPLEGGAEFAGKGAGVYGVLGANNVMTTYKTSFTAIVAVDFATNKVTLNSSTPLCVATDGFGDCNDTAITDAFAKLDVVGASTSLKDGKLDNVFIVADTMSGRLDARFYGSMAEEFGGTFALAEANKRYYYGAFGAMRGDFTASVIASFTDFSNATQGDKTAKTLEFPSLAVETSVTGDITRSNENVSWLKTALVDVTISNASLNAETAITTPKISINYNNGLLSETNVTFNDGTGNISYQLAAGGDGTATNASIEGVLDGDALGYMAVSTEQDFGFEANYMASASWYLLSDQKEIGGTATAGFLISGFETGYMLEIDDFDINTGALPLTGEVNFTGKGSGYYATNDGSSQALNGAIQSVEFAVSAAVDFASKDVTITTGNTRKYSCAKIQLRCDDAPRNVLSKLNFTTGELSYITNNVATSTLTIDAMTGSLDARFYGAEAQEFGGTFSARNADATESYMGVFGSQKSNAPPLNLFQPSKMFTFEMVGTEVAKNPQETDIGTYDSLNFVADDAVTLQGLAVALNGSSEYVRETTHTAWDDSDNLQITRQITPARVTSAAVTLTFDMEGALSGATAYVDVDYSNATADRSNIFGFDSDFMAYISWGIDDTFDEADTALTQTILNSDGAMIAGIESDVANFPSPTEKVGFTGKGGGVYGTVTESYDTVFDVTANVDFTARNVDINTTGTSCTDCGDFNASLLNITAQGVSFASDTNNDANTVSVNNISTDVTLVALESTLTGTLDARFYGIGDNATNELGGTFALADDTAGSELYYYGAFGAETDTLAAFTSNDWSNFNKGVTTIEDIDPQVNASDYDSLTAVSEGADTADEAKSVTMQGLAVLKNDLRKHSRKTTAKLWSDTANIKISTQIYVSRIDSPTAAVTLTFDEEGKIATVATYLDNDYTATGEDNETSTIFNASNDTNGSTKVERNTGVLGFDADYMVYVSWNVNSHVNEAATGLTQDTYSQTGRMIAGIETANEGFPTLTGDVIFNGKGKGVYGYYDAAKKLTTRNTVFDVVATADFTARTVGLAVKSTKCVGTCTNFTASNYNFSTALSFASDSNNDVNTTSVNSISKETMFNDNQGKMKGTVDARFYGTGAKEFGGAFAFTNDDNSSKRYYYGAFGAVRDSVFSNALATDTITPSPTETLAMGYASLTAAAVDTTNTNPVMKPFTLKALTVHRNLASNYTRSATDKAWDSGELTQSATLTRVKNSSASLTFGITGNLSAVTAHLSGDGTGDYAADTISNATATVLSANIMDAASDETTSINVDRSTIFDFDSAYMAYISWHIAQDENALDDAKLSDNISNINGMMIAGMETADNGIFTAAKNKFTGKGSGIYGNVVDGAIAEYNTSFKVTAIVDYEALNIALTTSETACTGAGNACDNITVPNALNFSAIASFSDGDANNPAAINAISGAVTAGDLIGTLDARFYGTGTDNANEMGGTFALVDDSNNSYYYGVFGTTRDGLAPFAFGVTNDYMFDAVAATNPQVTSIKDQDDSDVVADSLAAISMMADSATEANATISATMQAVAVLNTKNIDYERQTTDTEWTATEELKIDRTITTTQITSQSAMPAVKLTFDNNGNISGVTVYADADYTATGTASSSTGFTGMMGDTAINVDRSEDFFGFESQYMAYIGWRADTEADLDGGSNITTTANANTLNGAMIAGVETTNIPTENIIQFRGKGTGVYTSVAEQYNTIFTVRANVDFTGTTADFTTDKTACTGACSFITVPSSLNFSIVGASFADGGNNAVNNITFTEDTSARQVRFDARFYGAEAEELGGTFALHNKQENYHYHGAFGGKESPIIFSEDQTTTIGGLPDINNAYISDNSKRLVAHSAVVHSNRVVNYSRNTASDAWGAGELSTIKIETNNYHAATAARIKVETDSNSKMEVLEVYFDDKKYISSKSSGKQSKYYTHQIDITNSTFGDSNDSANGFKNNVIIADGRDGTVGIGNNTALALIYWQLNENDPVMESMDTSYSQQLSHGYGVVGTNATSDAVIDFKHSQNGSGSQTFTGKSIGSYSPQGEKEATKLTKSTISATFNFDNNTGTLTSKNTIGRGANANETFSELDFTADIPDFGGKNKVSGTAQTDDVGANNLNMQGTIDARFYGKFGYDFGGTFELRGDTGDIPATYIGAFAGELN